MRTISAVGEDDAAPRQYQDGDGLHRVHWKSTARYGELMVRREEHQWRNSASVFLDTRRSAHTGTGPASTFEFAVSAAASIGAHLSGEGFRARLITDAGEIAPRGTFQDTLLDMLAVITPSHATGFRTGTSELAQAGGQLIAVIGRLSAEDARQLAASRRGNAPAMALLLAVSAWASDRISRGHGADGGDPVGRGLAGRGGQREHAARDRLAAAAPPGRPGRPAGADRRSRR